MHHLHSSIILFSVMLSPLFAFMIHFSSSLAWLLGVKPREASLFKAFTLWLFFFFFFFQILFYVSPDDFQPSWSQLKKFSFVNFFGEFGLDLLIVIGRWPLAGIVTSKAPGARRVLSLERRILFFWVGLGEGGELWHPSEVSVQRLLSALPHSRRSACCRTPGFARSIVVRVANVCSHD